MMHKLAYLDFLQEEKLEIYQYPFLPPMSHIPNIAFIKYFGHPFIGN